MVIPIPVFVRMFKYEQPNHGEQGRVANSTGRCQVDRHRFTVVRTQRGESVTTSPHAPNLGDRAYYHRTLLLNAMEDAGFTNHATEFWHFPAADRYDALMRREPHALYGAIELR
ncbi:M15 family metallopeptidase [Streptomyces sp. McG3]|uniref:M15 family metallopeptidase n=1 Tax=Streptomyces sp. McG3 TaxID=2725483 RepID=UPI002036AF14|nr:M15 family metallopeptidase [Streptomyces sp. McG3]